MFPDPIQMWRDALTRLESDVNAALTGSTKSQEVVRSLHQFSSTALGMQQMFEKVIESYLRRANLPSRKQIAELAESLRRMEDKLDRLLPTQALGAPARRPARTRRPPAAAPAPEPAPAPASAPEANRTRRGTSTRKKGR